MISYRLGFYQAEPRRAEELIRAIKRHPGCCDTVWLTAMGYYPSLERHKKYAADWIPIAKMFRDAGIRVSMQIANTVGHGYWEQLRPELNDPFIQGMLPRGGEEPYLVGPDGAKNESCFCWRSPQLREYINSVVAIYAEAIKPYRLWFDDDLRAHNHSHVLHGCYCERCIAEFNRQEGTDYTRAELVERMNYSDLDLRQKYIDFIRRGMYDFTYGAVKACLAVAPDTRFGLEYEHLHNYHGVNDEHILGALYDASGREVETRPGASYYNDKAPFEQYEKALCLSAANSLLPTYVTASVAEIEDLPGVAFGKSIGGIANEGTLDLAVGCTGLTFTDVQSCHEPMEYYERIFARIAELRPYWERLSKVSKTCSRSGVAIYWGTAPHLSPSAEGAPLCAWDRVLLENDIRLMRLGVPLTYEQSRPAAYLLHHATVDAMTDADIEFLLTRPVITDGESVAKLIMRGFANRFSLTPEPLGNLSEEHFTDSPINTCPAGSFYNENPYAASEPMQRYVFRDLDETTEVIGIAFSDHFLGNGKEFGPCTLVTRMQGIDSREVRWAIFGYSIWSDIVSAAKRNQILGALDAIAPMPTRILSDEQAVVIPSVDGEGRVVAATVSSASQSGTEDVRLAVRCPRGKDITVMGTCQRSIHFTVVEQGEAEIILCIESLLPYETVTLFFD